MARHTILRAVLAASAAASCALAPRHALAQEGIPDAAASRPVTLEAVKALRTAYAAKAAAAAVHAEVAAAAPPANEILRAPPAPTPPPVLSFAAETGATGQDLLGSTEAMPVASAKLLAALTAEPAAPVAPAAPAAPTPVPAFIPALAAPPALPVPAPAPTLAPPTLLAALGTAPIKLPSAEALEAAVAAQTTPIPVAPAPVYAAAPPPPAPRPQFSAASFAPPRARRRAAQTGNARFMRAVVSTAAVSVDMPDLGRDISPLGIMLGQLVRAQETPGTQYGLAEEMAMPTRPRLMAMPEVALPQSFCSAEQRSAFMEGIYQPAMAIARHNSELASGYVRKLRTLYDNYQLSGDSRAQAAIAAEARDFARTSSATSSIQEELAAQFEDIMTIPVNACGASQ